ncbi:serine/threonine-protein phosphatase 6 regulatory ankyrin repeat subunit B-like [Mytilus californianus]|uniref:serine/threonine-protein phosphatase 6 regulatory ankyrin repeat subunit B-like n=1 Tax=Mytilus californianus TaxID=6549 RepID=UPI002246C823|nr:serine/threonine-protein phosphatase 6 regulatory ankyrin repeat subunit B-like [Mytilus californianus]
MLSDAVQNETKDFIRDIFEESGFKQYPTKHVLLMSFTSLHGEFTKCNGNVFSFVSTELFDSVASCIGGSFIQSILKYSSSEFIMEKLQLYSSQEDNCPYSIKVPQDMEDYFYRRLTSDMNRRHFVDILSNKLFENAANRTQFIKYLEKRVKSENLVDATTGSTVFHIVSALGYSDFLKHFLEFDNCQNINTRNFKGRTSLHLASKNGKMQCVECLLQQKVVLDRIDKMDKKGRTALHYACRAGDKDIVKCLIGSKASTNIVDKKSRTPLHIACIKGFLDTVKCLAENKANINESGKDGKTPLHYACENRFGNIVNTLIMENAIVNKPDDQDLTPLHIACTYGYEEIVKLLLDNKPLTNIKNKQGQTAVNIAIQKGFQNISKLIIDSS